VGFPTAGAENFAFFQFLIFTAHGLEIRTLIPKCRPTPYPVVIPPGNVE